MLSVVPGLCLFQVGDSGCLSRILCHLEQAPNVFVHNASEGPKADWFVAGLQTPC